MLLDSAGKQVYKEFIIHRNFGGSTISKSDCLHKGLIYCSLLGRKPCIYYEKLMILGNKPNSIVEKEK